MSVTRSESASRLPTLLFVRRRQCGASRKMESLVAWIKVTRKRSVRVLVLDADRHPEAVRQLRVRCVPALVLMKDGNAVGRLEGRSTGRQIDALIREHAGGPEPQATAHSEREPAPPPAPRAPAVRGVHPGSAGT